MSPALAHRGGTWVGWPGAVVAEDHIPDLERRLGLTSSEVGYALAPVWLDREEHQGFYEGFSNEVLWPLFHDMSGHAYMDPKYWDAYVRVNWKFAHRVRDVCQPRSGTSLVWVHDYHLMLQAKMLRELGVRAPIGFFLHIPFPGPDIYLKVPWRQEILRALLDYDLVGFQTPRDARNFFMCLRSLVPEASVTGKGFVRTIDMGKCSIRAGVFPVGIDFKEFAEGAESEGAREKEAQMRRLLPDKRLVLGVDRLDYTKGIPHRLQGYRAFLRKYPQWRGKVTLVQVVVPSRIQVPHYAQLRHDIETLVGRINGEFTQMGWIPVHYLFRSLSRTDLLAYYRAADVVLVTPLKDGMNLVAKEYCAAKTRDDGVVILSEFAGVAWQFKKNALLVNPYDTEGIGEAIQRALTMEATERQTRMRRMRQIVRKRDVHWWVGTFLHAAFARDLDDFPVLEEGWAIPPMENNG